MLKKEIKTITKYATAITKKILKNFSILWKGLRADTAEENFRELEDRGIDNILITRKQICNCVW